MRFVTGETVPQVAVLLVHEYCLILQRAGQTFCSGQAMDTSHQPPAPPRCQASPGHGHPPEHAERQLDHGHLCEAQHHSQGAHRGLGHLAGK